MVMMGTCMATGTVVAFGIVATMVFHRIMAVALVVVAVTFIVFVILLYLTDKLSHPIQVVLMSQFVIAILRRVDIDFKHFCRAFGEQFDQNSA